MGFSIYNLAHSIAGASIYLSSIPMQILGASSTHVFCNQQGRLILSNDGHKHASRLFNRFFNEIDKGVIWADRGWRSLTHHFNPETARGIWPWGNAADKCACYFQKALRLWRRGKHVKAMFLLGAAAHLVQDACVPHHAFCQMFDGHLEYEKWVKKHVYHYKVRSGGLYNLGNTPQEWVSTNASFARKYYCYVKNPGDYTGYHEATAILLPRAQRVTAGFFHFCLMQLFRE